MGEVVVEIDGLRVRRKGFELQVPAWRVRQGEVVGVVGANAAGKSTLLDTVVGLVVPADGEVRVFGADPARQRKRVRAELGVVSRPPLFRGTVRRLLLLTSAYYPDWDDALAADLVARFQLDLSKKWLELSKGEGARASLVLALSHRPRLVVLDEADAGLDLEGRRTLLRTLMHYLEDVPSAVVLASHHLEDVARVADRLLVLREGRVLRQGPTPELVSPGGSLESAMASWGMG
jgi:ABC-2 type transport system ATP-binding protein